MADREMWVTFVGGTQDGRQAKMKDPLPPTWKIPLPPPLTLRQEEAVSRVELYVLEGWQYIHRRTTDEPY